MGLIRAIALKDFRGTVANATANALSTTDVSTGYNLGTSNDALKQLFGGLHLTNVVGASSTTRVAVFTIQNASSSGFGVISTQGTFALSTVQGGEWLPPTAVGSLSTDKPWWRLSWTMSTVGSTGGTWNGLAWMGTR